MTVVQSSILTINQRIALANDVINNWTTSNVYVVIGGETPYTANDALVPVPNQSVDYENAVFRGAIALKKITASGMAFMIPRVDWQTGIKYDFWDDAVDMYSTIQLTSINGTVNVSNSRTVTGVNTTFLSQVSSGNFIYLAGDGEFVAPQTLQVTDVFSNTSLNVNTAFSGSFVSNVPLLVTNVGPRYGKNFYVRNSFDQVFICLFNNNVVSNTMPVLSIGGDLPQNPFIITADGYLWKYLYTIPPGQKQQFFSSDWMPVYSDPTTVAAAVDGRIDLILINTGGTGYNGNVASNSATIIVVTGDGTGTSVTAKVNASGTITGINILNGGQGFTLANVSANTGVTGTGVDLRAIIGPKGGHGFSPVYELGATTLMISVDLIGNEGGTLPTGASIGTGIFDYRQVSLLQDPVLVASGNTASNTNYSTITTVSVQPLPAGSFFNLDETVFQGPTLVGATFVGTVVYWDSVNSVLWLNNLSGSFQAQQPIVGTIQTTPVTAFIITQPTIKSFTGKLLYVNNVLPVIRGLNQTEQIRVLLQF